VPEPYELLKHFTRGKATLTIADLHAFVDQLPVTDAIKAELKALTPAEYLGLSAQISLTIVAKM
jgi:adenylosuccinate lyase